MTVKDRMYGCLIGGAIGDAWGSSFEQLQPVPDQATYYVSRPPAIKHNWAFTDDTQLTLVTLEALLAVPSLSPEQLAQHFSNAYSAGLLTNLGASTCKALRELAAGGHWNLVGRTGEFSAGNGAAMRIAPVAFWPQYSRLHIADFCRITHRHDEAYIGALAVILSIRAVLKGRWTGKGSLLDILIEELPDTRTRDRLLELQHLPPEASVADAARLGTSGYVVDSVPFAVYCASRVTELGFTRMMEAILASGGDTDTNASIAGQIAGTLLGAEALPATLRQKLQQVRNYGWLERSLSAISNMM